MSSLSPFPPPPAARLPKAAVAALLVCLALTALSWLAVRLHADADRQHLVFVGDSFTGNYRFAEPERLQDLANRGLPPGWQAFNFGAPGAFTLDIWLQAQQALTLTGRVDALVLPLFVGKLAPAKAYARLDERGDMLKWLRLEPASAPALQALDSELTKKLAIHKAGLVLFGAWDLGEHLFNQQLKNPWERQRMLDNSPERRAGIQRKVADHARDWHAARPTLESYTASPAAQDLELLVQWAKAQQIPVLVLVIPDGDPDAIAAHYSPEAKQHLAEALAVVQAWCDARGLAHRDLTQALAGGLYDDFTHLNAVRGNQILVDAALHWLRSQPGLP
jgi:hypothetical protein